MKLNSAGVVRGMIARNYYSELYMIYVGEAIERQLKEWDKAYHVNIMKFKDYIFVVKHGEKDYWLEITEDELAVLQQKSPYALDYKIWFELNRQGLAIYFGYGNYLEKVFGKKGS